jgi:hypothetical protein
MTEQEQYECFAIPAHVWDQHRPVVESQRAGWPRRTWVHLEAAMLGVEAMPSPPIDTIA